MSKHSKSKGKRTHYDDYDDYEPYGSDSRIGFKRNRGYGDDYYYGGGYSRKSSYYSDYSNWNWGNYGYTELSEDNDKDLYVKAHEGYYTPTNVDISSKINHKANTQKNRSLIKELARYFYYRMLDDKDYFEEKYSDPEKLTEEEMANFQVKKGYYEDLWDKYVPGVTPLEQALAIFEQLNNERKEPSADISMEEVAQKVQGMEFHEELCKDPEINELLDMQELAKTNKFDIFNKISLIQNLGSQFKIEKEVEEKLAHNSRLISKKIMRDYSQIYNIDLYQRLMPTFPSKLLTKDLVVNVPIEKTEHKQKIIILLDYSGSMSWQDKQKWVLAIMIDRLRYAMKEEAEIFFSYFVNNPDHLHFHHIYDRKSALAFWAKFSTHPNGGDTYLGDMVNRIDREIKNKKLKNLNVDLSNDKPEILAINDGQDSVKTSGFVYKTNAITLVDSENQELKKLCIDNDGKYVYIDASGKMKTYDKSSKK